MKWAIEALSSLSLRWLFRISLSMVIVQRFALEIFVIAVADRHCRVRRLPPGDSAPICDAQFHMTPPGISRDYPGNGGK
ncbi:hypothetical protein [Bradyrhizobium rifense]|uniref:hypothetical protein n=1 Tax=Bradyrhizobium rifense TaxID=515499 RepID=UPI00165316D6